MRIDYRAGLHGGEQGRAHVATTRHLLVKALVDAHRVRRSLCQKMTENLSQKGARGGKGKSTRRTQSLITHPSKPARVL